MERIIIRGGRWQTGIVCVCVCVCVAGHNREYLVAVSRSQIASAGPDVHKE